MKKKIIIATCILISLIVSLLGDGSAFLVDSKELITILLTLLGLCFTGYTFIYSPITNILEKKNKNGDNIKNTTKKLLKSMQQDMLFIFGATLFIIGANLVLSIDFPLIENPINVNFGLFIIPSLKIFVINFVISAFACLSFFAFYDLIKATFKIFTNCFE